MAVGKYQTCKGFSLLEVLFAVGISGILFLIIIQIYISVKQHSQFQQVNSDRLERARLATHILRTAVRQAGFIGCRAVTHYPDFLQVDNSKSLLPAGDQMMVVYHAIGENWQPDLPTAIQGKVKIGTDVIKVQHLGPSLSSVQQNMESNKQVLVSATLPFKAGDTVMISDCGHVDTFKLASVHSQGGLLLLNSMRNLNDRYHQYAAIGFIETQIFYIRQSPYMTPDDAPIFSLYLNDGSNVHEELVAGIEDMHVQILGNNPTEMPLVKITFKVNALLTNALWKKTSGDPISNDWEMWVALR